MSHDFYINYALAKMAGAADPIATANVAMGVTSSVEGDLMLRARDLMQRLEEWYAAPTRRRVLIRRELKVLVRNLYTDICPEHQDIVHLAIRRQCATAKSPAKWADHRSCFYEMVQKWLMKTGCTTCPLQKRF